MPKRINAILSDPAASALDSLVRDLGKTKSEVLRDAIALERWFYEAQREGSRVLVERDGKLREIVPRVFLSHPGDSDR